MRGDRQQTHERGWRKRERRRERATSKNKEKLKKKSVRKPAGRRAERTVARNEKWNNVGATDLQILLMVVNHDGGRVLVQGSTMAGTENQSLGDLG